MAAAVEPTEQEVTAPVELLDVSALLAQRLTSLAEHFFRLADWQIGVFKGAVGLLFLKDLDGVLDD